MVGWLELLRQLVEIPTVNSENGEEVVERVLSYLKGDYQYGVVKVGGVENLLVWKGRPFLALNAHYDVVPPGEEGLWSFDPFKAVHRDGYLYGRGTSDDKGALAAFVDAFNRLEDALLMVVGDEEKGGQRGTRALVDRVKKMGVKYALVGEPVSKERFGDRIRKGARGVLWLRLGIMGKGGHASRVEELNSPLNALPLLLDRSNLELPTDGRMVDTTVAVTCVEADGGAVNVIPSRIEVKVDVRYNIACSADVIEDKIREMLEREGFGVEIERLEDEPPYLNSDEAYGTLVVSVLRRYGANPSLTTYGGTSDARFFSAVGVPVLEIGPVARNIHGVDEHVRLEELELLSSAVGDLQRALSQRVRGPSKP